MIMFKELELLFAHPAVIEQFQKTKELYNKRCESDSVMMQYKYERKILKSMLEVKK